MDLHDRVFLKIFITWERFRSLEKNCSVKNWLNKKQRFGYVFFGISQGGMSDRPEDFLKIQGVLNIKYLLGCRIPE